LYLDAFGAVFKVDVSELLH